MKTAQEVKQISQSKEIREKFFKAVENAIDKAADEGLSFCELLYWEPLIGDVYALYDGKDKDKCLTNLGKQLVKELEDLGYNIGLTLYYEERQLVDFWRNYYENGTISWLKFRISWL